MKEQRKYKCRCGKVITINKDGTIPQHIRPMSRAYRLPGARAWDIDRCGLSGLRLAEREAEAGEEEWQKKN